MPALDDLNATFHAFYDEASGDQQPVAPVFVVLADSLVVFRADQRTERTLHSQVFHDIKSVVHVPIAIFSLLARRDAAGTGHVDGSHRPALDSLRSGALASCQKLETLPREARPDADAVLRSSAKFLDRALSATAVSRSELEAFAGEMGPVLLRLTEHATRARLAALHQAVEAELASMTVEERAALQVVVAGDHQARVRSLAVQYFQKRFDEPSGADRRVAYAEGLEDPALGPALVRKRILDREIAAAFFGDPARLQRDVLGDAAALLIANSRLEPIA